MAKNFNKLRDQLLAKPGGAARVEKARQELADFMLLADLRKARGATQEQIADAMEVSQANVSQLERSVNPQVDSLDRYVEALGGHLEIAAVFADGQVVTLGRAAREEQPA